MSLASSEPTHPSFQLLESTLRLWAAAQYSITKNRRANIISAVFPKYAALLKDTSKFASSEMGFLFGPTFLSTLLKAVDDDNKLKQAVKKTNSSYPQSSERRSTRLANKEQHQQGNQPQASGSGEQSGKSNYQPTYNKRYSPISRSITLNSFSTETPKVGARLLGFLHEWRKISGDPWILSTVAHGYRIDFLSQPHQTVEPPVGGMSDAMTEICDREVEDLLKKGAIIPVLDSSPGFYTRLFAVPKPNSDLFRPIINLKPVNASVRHEHFKMENLESVKHLLKQGDWMVKLDLKDAYFTVPVFEDHQRFLRFRWRGSSYQFVCLPFGLSSAPRTFTKIMKPVMTVLRSLGIRVVIYLDDLLFLNESEQGVSRDLDIAIELLERLGFIINWPKSHTTPCQVIQYLGMVIDSRLMSFSLPESKFLKMRSMCQQALSRNRVKLRDLASIMGNFSWAILAIPFAQSHYRSVQRSLIDSLAENGGDFDGFVSLSRRARTELEW